MVITPVDTVNNKLTKHLFLITSATEVNPDTS